MYTNLTMAVPATQLLFSSAFVLIAPFALYLYWPYNQYNLPLAIHVGARKASTGFKEVQPLHGLVSVVHNSTQVLTWQRDFWLFNTAKMLMKRNNRNPWNKLFI